MLRRIIKLVKTKTPLEKAKELQVKIIANLDQAEKELEKINKTLNIGQDKNASKQIIGD